MANANPQAIAVSNNRIRPLADSFGSLYNQCKAYQAEAQAEGWAAMFPADGQVISDGADMSGRTIITNTDVSQFITLAGAYITFMEQTANANRNLALKIATDPNKF